MTLPVLLDTHIVLWARLAPDKLSPVERATILAAPRRYISAVSAWEIAILMALGRVPRDSQLVGDVPSGFETLDISQRHACELLALPPLHRDPFDRMLIAQARSEQFALLTRDRQIARYADAGLTVLGG